jgi:hypothetical protein
MNQLSNNVIDFARFRRAANNARRLTATDFGSRRGRGALLACRWRREAATGRLICVWAAGKGARDAQPPSRCSLAA